LAALLSGHALERRQLGHAQRVQLGQGAHEAAVDELIDELVAQAFDVHRAAARRKCSMACLRCAGAVQARRAAVVDAALLAQHALPHTGHCRGMRKLGT
jgi:uncharacterized protein YggL (DUF469 family)